MVIAPFDPCSPIAVRVVVMEMKMLRSIGVVAVGALLAVAASGTARAGGTTGTLAQDPGYSYGMLYGYAQGSINYTGPGGPVSYGDNALAGEMLMDFTVNRLTSYYSVFCTDIFNEWSSGNQYTLTPLTDYTQFASGNSSSPGISQLQYDQLLALLNGVDATNYITGKSGQAQADASAGVQLAVWEIINEAGAGAGTYNVTSGKFSVDLPGYGTYDTTATGDANTLLSLVGGTSPSWNNYTGVLSEFTPYPSGTGNQNFSFLTVSQRGSSVPEPGSLALLATGLAGFAALRRRARG